MKKLTTFILLLCSVAYAQGQLKNDDVHKLTEMRKSGIRELIRIPDVQGYKTLKCDFHIHTVFSDGKVWPDVRVSEAWQEGLDAIAITDHIEYRPLKNTIKGDLNESFKIAKKKGDDLGFIVIQGTEITRSKPIGHLNALFITDANPMDTEDPVDAIDIAVKQGAFIMWNHPGWPDNKSTFYPVHDSLIKANKIHGVEVFNHMESYPLTFDWCKNLNLAFMGNSDEHDMIKFDYGSCKLSRPVTLVFASELSEKAIKEALFAKRSAAYFNGVLVGKSEHLSELFKNSLDVAVKNAEKGIYEITNTSDITYTITLNNERHVFHAGKTTRITLPREGQIQVVNCFTGMDENLLIDLSEWL